MAHLCFWFLATASSLALPKHLRIQPRSLRDNVSANCSSNAKVPCCFDVASGPRTACWQTISAAIRQHVEPSSTTSTYTSSANGQPSALSTYSPLASELSSYDTSFIYANATSVSPASSTSGMEASATAWSSFNYTVYGTNLDTVIFQTLSTAIQYTSVISSYDILSEISTANSSSGSSIATTDTTEALSTRMTSTRTTTILCTTHPASSSSTEVSTMPYTNGLPDNPQKAPQTTTTTQISQFVAGYTGSPHDASQIPDYRSLSFGSSQSQPAASTVATTVTVTQPITVTVSVAVSSRLANMTQQNTIATLSGDDYAGNSATGRSGTIVYPTSSRPSSSTQSHTSPSSTTSATITNVFSTNSSSACSYSGTSTSHTSNANRTATATRSAPTQTGNATATLAALRARKTCRATTTGTTASSDPGTSTQNHGIQGNGPSKRALSIFEDAKHQRAGVQGHSKRSNNETTTNPSPIVLNATSGASRESVLSHLHAAKLSSGSGNWLWLWPWIIVSGLLALLRLNY
jgi:hypothetical protein